MDDDSTAENEADTYGFVGMFASQLGLTYYNAGYNGQTTASLIASLSDPTSSYFDSTALAAIPSANVITITIGGNDLMAVFYSFIAEVVTGGAYDAATVETILTDIETYETQALTILGLLSSKDYSSELEKYTAFTNAISTAVTNINTVTSAINQYNSSAIILVANQYNPYTWLGSSYQNITNLFETGVTYFNTALSNAASKNYTIVDIYSAFAASKTELTNITLDYYEFDYHPNDSGHLVFKNTMITAYNEALTSGSGGTTVVSESSIQLGTGSISGYDSTNGYSYIYLGVDSNGNQVKWRVLDDQTNMGTAGLYLLSDTIVDSGVTYSSSGSRDWQGSDAQAWCEDYYANNLSAIEQSAIIATTKSDSAYTNSSLTFTCLATDDILNGDYVFFMSAEEIFNSDYGFTDDNSRIVDYYQTSTSTVNTAVYFLRSPANNGSQNTTNVSQLGQVGATWSGYTFGARPAMNFDTSNVMFVSAASGGKSATGMDSGLTAVETSTGSEWKATIYDSNRAGFTASKVSRGINTVTIEYSGAKIGANEYLSAVVLDDNGEITQYGRIAKLDGTTYSNSGTVTFDISSLADTDTLYIINEQYNGDYASDASSALTAIDTTMTFDDLTSEVARLEAELSANNQAIITSANSSLTASLLNFATIVNDSNSTTADIIDGVMALLIEYSSAYTSWEQITAQNPADTTLLTSLATLEATLATAESAITTAITTLQTNITTQISDLKTADAELLADLTALQTTINNLDGAYATDSELGAAVTSLNTAIADAQQAAIDAAQASLEKAVDDLNKAITDGDSDLADEIAALEAAMNTADDIINSSIAALQTKDNVIELTIARLNSNLLNAQETLQNAVDAVQQNLNDAVANLEAAIAAGNEDLSNEIEALNTAFTAAANLINTNIAALQTADSELETSIAALETAVNSADGVLQTAIDELQRQLNDLKAEHEAAITDAQTSTSTLQTVCIAMFTVTGILSVAGVGMSAALWIVTRKRR